MQDFFYALLLLPVFLTIECTRFAFWTSRVSTTPPPFTVPAPLLLLLRAVLYAVVWVIWVVLAWVLWVPVRAILWVAGIGRDGAYRRASAAATARWYELKRQRAREEGGLVGLASQRSGRLSLQWR